MRYAYRAYKDKKSKIKISASGKKKPRSAGFMFRSTIRG
jgi:hypothetical protein